jgi:hypothetical protein
MFWRLSWLALHYGKHVFVIRRSNRTEVKLTCTSKRNISRLLCSFSRAPSSCTAERSRKSAMHASLPPDLASDVSCISVWRVPDNCMKKCNSDSKDPVWGAVVTCRYCTHVRIGSSRLHPFGLCVESKLFVCSKILDSLVTSARLYKCDARFC